MKTEQVPRSFSFEIPVMPPSVNHYVEHPAHGVHIKSVAAKSWADQFPLFARDLYAVSATKRFAASIDLYPGPKGRGDVDNYNKMPLDCCAARGMLRSEKGELLSDAAIKALTVRIFDSAEDRKLGPKLVIMIKELL